MECNMALLADSANVSDAGKLNILGAFDQIGAPGFPVRHEAMTMVLRFDASPAEVGEQKEGVIRCLDEDGTQLGQLTATITIPPPSKPGQRVKIQTIIPLENMVFPKAGAYSFHVMINGETKADIPLALVEA